MKSKTKTNIDIKKADITASRKKSGVEAGISDLIMHTLNTFTKKRLAGIAYFQHRDLPEDVWSKFKVKLIDVQYHSADNSVTHMEVNRAA